VRAAGDDSEGVVDFSLVVVLGFLGPDASLSDINNVEDVLPVDESSVSADSDGDGPGTGDLAASSNHSSLGVKNGP